MTRSIQFGLMIGILSIVVGDSTLESAADEIHLIHGGRIVGDVEKPAGEPERIVVQTPFGGRVVLQASQVERVVEMSKFERGYLAMLPSVPDTVAGHLAMADKCQQAKLEEQRLFHLQQVLRHEPDHKMARGALGYSRINGRWLRQDEWMAEQGYVRYRGSWRLPQEIALMKDDDDRESIEVEWRKKLKTWKTWIIKRRENSEEGVARIRAIRDPLAITGLAELLRNDKELQFLKLIYVDVLSQIPSGEAAGVLAYHTINNEDGRVREACLDRLEQTKPPSAVLLFIQSLKHDKNHMVNRAAIALGQMRDPIATLPLIESLITEHKYLVGGGPGLQTSFSNQGGGRAVSGWKAGGQEDQAEE